MRAFEGYASFIIPKLKPKPKANGEVEQVIPTRPLPRP